MKLAIVSDLHLGYERFREDAYNQAREALEKAAELADAVIIPGDIFDMRHPKPEVLAEAINLFRTLAQSQWKARVIAFEGKGAARTNSPIIAIPGTHERRAADTADPVDLLGLAGFLVDVSDAYAIIEKDGERVAVTGLGGISEERFREALNVAAPKPVKDAFNVFMIHQSVYELLPFSKDFINLDELPKGFDLYIDGHIHNRVERRVHGKPFLIPGSTVLTQLKEGEQEAKGFYVFDTKTGEHAFHAIDSRKFIHVKLTVDGKSPGEIRDMVVRSIESTVAKHAGKPIIRVELNGRLKDGVKHIDIDVHDVPKRFEGKAIIEIARSGVDGVEASTDIEELRSGTMGNMSVKDYGLSLFLEKLLKSGYTLKVNPSELFEMLSAEGAKDKAVKGAMDKIFEGA